jgi:Transposase DDE domain
MPKQNCISQSQNAQPHRNQAQADLQTLQAALQPLGWNQARIKCLAAFLVAILTVQSVNLVKIANVFPTEATKGSAYKRLQRFLKDFSPNLDILAYFLAGLCKIPAPWSLSMDRTNWKLGKRHLNILMLSIVAPGITFPLMWIVLEKQGKGKAGNSNTTERIKLLERFIKIFGSQNCRNLFADREFAGRDFLKWLEDNNIQYCIRLKSNIGITNNKNKVLHACEYFKNSVGLENVLGYRKVFGKSRFVTGTRLADGDYLIVVSPLKVDLEEYALRWGIETMFGSFKTRGFNLEATHVTDVDRLSNLIALMAIAYTWAGAFGSWVSIQVKLRCLKHERAPICLFRLGLDALQNWMTSLCRTIKECQREKALQFLSCT